MFVFFRLRVSVNITDLLSVPWQNPVWLESKQTSCVLKNFVVYLRRPLSVFCFIFDALLCTWTTPIVRTVTLLYISMSCCWDRVRLTLEFVAKKPHPPPPPFVLRPPKHRLLKSLWHWWVQYVFFSSTTFSSSTLDGFFFDRKRVPDAVTWKYPTVTFPTLWKAPRSSAF